MNTKSRPPSYQGINFSDWRNWPPVVSRIDGRTYYRIPGMDTVFDPSRGANGTVTKLPEDLIADDKKAKEEMKEKEPGIVEQYAPGIVGAGTAVGTAYGIQQAMNPSTAPTNPSVPTGVQAARMPANTGAPVAGAGVGTATPTVSPGIVGATEAAPVITGASTAAEGIDAANAGIVQGAEGTANTGATAGQIAQGVGGALQVYNAYNQYKDGDYVGATVYGGAGAANIGSALGSQAASNVAPGLNAIAGAYGLYETAQYASDAPAGGRRNVNSTASGAAAGASLGTAVAPGIGTAVGAVLGGLYGLAMSYFGSSKDKYQMIRDEGRNSLKEFGILDENWQGTLADGSLYDFGKDGKEHGKLNTEDPNWEKAASLANVIATGEGMFGRPREAMATLYTNASLSNSGGDINNVIANAQHFAKQRGFTPENIQEQAGKLYSEGLISKREWDVYSSEIGTIFPGYKPPAEPPPLNEGVTEQEHKESGGGKAPKSPVTTGTPVGAASGGPVLKSGMSPAPGVVTAPVAQKGPAGVRALNNPYGDYAPVTRPTPNVTQTTNVPNPAFVMKNKLTNSKFSYKA